MPTGKPTIGEHLVRVFFEKCVSGSRFYNYRPDFLKWRTGRNLELDIFFPELKIAVEFNGIHHGLRYQKEKDAFKAEKCKELGIHLLVVTHPVQLLLRDWWEKNGLPNFIKDWSGKRLLFRVMRAYKAKKTKSGHMVKYRMKIEEWGDKQREEVEKQKVRREFKQRSMR